MIAPRFPLLLAVLALSAPALAAPAETPEAFVRRVYARYGDKGPGVPMTRPAGTPYYAAPLLDAFAKDGELAGGEVGSIEGDPVCDCQDWGKLRVRQVAVTPGQNGAVLARVAFSNFNKPQTVTLTLVATSDGWRIADIGNGSAPSVLTLLHKAAKAPAR